MKNYSLTVNSTFQPFTYQELAAPLDRQELYHEKLAEEYDKLSSQADVLEAMGANDRDKSSGAYSRYKAYSDKLRQEADDLYKFGLNTESRQRLSDLRRMYNTEIVPIQNAWTKRKEEADMQIKAQLQHPELRFTRDAANTSLDEYINNPEGGFGVVNLNNITAQMAQAAQNLAKQAREGRKESIDDYTSRFITPYGIDPNLIRDWMNNPNASSTLTNMMNEVLQANGITSEEFLNTPNGKRIMQEAIGAAQRGAWSAVGEDKEHIIEDYGKRLEAKINAEAGATGNSGNGTTYGNPKFDTRNVRTAADIAKVEQEKSDWDNYKRYFYKNSSTGNWVMTSEGRKKYNESPYKWRGVGSVATNDNKTSFKEWVDNRGLSEMAKGRSGKYQTGIIDSMMGRINNIMDVNTAIEYTKNIGATNYDNVISILNKDAIDGEIPVYERTGKNGTYSYQKKGNDKVKVSELASGDIKSAQVIYGKHGDFLEVKLKDGSTILQPYSVLSNTYSRVVEGNRGNIKKYNEAKKRGIKAIEIRPGKVVSIDDLINEELNSYGSNLMSALSFDEVEPDKTKPDYYGTR